MIKYFMAKYQKIKQINGDRVTVEFISDSNRFNMHYDLIHDHAISPLIPSIFIVKIRQSYHARYHDSNRATKSLSQMIAGLVFGVGVVQLRYNDNNPLNLVSSNLVPVASKKVGERQIGDFIITESHGSFHNAKCKKCGYTRCRTSTFNIRKFSTCSKCRRDASKGVLSKELSYDGVNMNCNKGHVFPVKYVRRFIENQNKCIICHGSRTSLDKILKLVPQYQYLGGDYQNYTSKIRLRCDKGHEYVSNGNKIQRGLRCPHCSPSKPMSPEEFLGAITEGGFFTYISGALRLGKHKITMKCPVGHERKIGANHARYYSKVGCLVCNAHKYRSSHELEIQSWLRDWGVDFSTNDRSIISPLELDIYIRSLNIAIEINGVYYHSTKFVGRNKHRLKYEACRDAGVTLVTIFENELLEDKPTVKENLLKYISGSDIYEPSETITVDCAYPLRRKGYRMVKTIDPSTFEYRGHKIYNCGQEVYARENVAHQKIVKDSTYHEDLDKYGPDIFCTKIDDYILAQEPFSPEIRDFVTRYEWLGTVGVTPRWCFTARVNGILAGIVCLNEPNAYSKLLGGGTHGMEALIQRGASASFAHQHLGSKLIMHALRWMVNNTSKRVFYGYSDPDGGEIGTIYQACNFDYLGSGFGAKVMYTHPRFNNGKPFTAQKLKRTSLWKKMYKVWHGVDLPKEWLSPSGFKDIKFIRSVNPEAVEEFYGWGKQILRESTKVRIPLKGKYVKILGKDKRETRRLLSLAKYRPLAYPKRSNDS